MLDKWKNRVDWLLKWWQIVDPSVFFDWCDFSFVFLLLSVCVCVRNNAMRGYWTPPIDYLSNGCCSDLWYRLVYCHFSFFCWENTILYFVVLAGRKKDSFQIETFLKRESSSNHDIFSCEISPFLPTTRYNKRFHFYYSIFVTCLADTISTTMTQFHITNCSCPYNQNNSSLFLFGKYCCMEIDWFA